VDPRGRHLIDEPQTTSADAMRPHDDVPDDPV
jgi:hypothetical protein